jgi:phospholipid-translocating ATPase
MLDNNNVVLRGCSLKINSYAIGMCLYNGHESKIFLNSGNPHPKKSHL